MLQEFHSINPLLAFPHNRALYEISSSWYVCSPCSNSSSFSAKGRRRKVAHLHWVNTFCCAFTCIADSTPIQWNQHLAGIQWCLKSKLRRDKQDKAWELLTSIPLLLMESWTLNYHPSTTSSILLLKESLHEVDARSTVQFLLFGKGTILHWVMSWRQILYSLQTAFLWPICLSAPSACCPSFATSDLACLTCNLCCDCYCYINKQSN